MNAFVRQVSNLSGVESWKIVYFAQMNSLEGLSTLSRRNKSRGNIYKKGKGRSQIYDGLGSRGCQLILDNNVG